MADSAVPPQSEGSDSNAPKRETLRISLPPRPLKPASTKITPRPNISAATTLPINPSASSQGMATPTMNPAWSTAVTKPIATLSRPPSGAIPKLPPKPPALASLPPKPSAPPMTGAPPSSKTTPLFPLRSPAQPVTALGASTSAPQSAHPITAVISNPGVEKLAPPAPPSGKGGVESPRVIVANPRAKVYVQSGKIEMPEDVESVPHKSKPPALPVTQNLPTGIAKPAIPAVSLSPAPQSPPISVPSARTPEPLTPQPPLIPAKSAPGQVPPKIGVTEAVGRPLGPDGKIAPVQVKKPTGALRLVDLPVNPASQIVTQAMEPQLPTPPRPPLPVPVAKSEPVPAPTPAVPEAPKPMPPMVPQSAATPPVSSPRKTAAIPPPPPPNTRKLEAQAPAQAPVPPAPQRPSVVTPAQPIVSLASAATTAPVEPAESTQPKKKSSTVMVPPNRISKSVEGTAQPKVPPPPTPASTVLPDKTSVAPPRRTQAMPLAASAVASAVMPKVSAPAPVIPTPAGPVASKPVTPLPSPGVKPPGAVLPVSPVKPGSPAPAPVVPVGSAPAPIKPAAATPAVQPPEGNKKSGTSVVKNAPPKETARITVKPSLPTPGAPRAGVGNISTVKPSGTGTAVVAGAATGMAATPTVKAAGATSPSVPAAKAKAVATPAPVKYQEEEPAGSTTLTTALAGGLAVVTWGTAGLLFASLMQYI